MLRAPRLGCEDGSIQGERPERAEITGRAGWVGIAWAILAAPRRDLLELLPVQGAETGDNVAGYLVR